MNSTKIVRTITLLFVLDVLALIFGSFMSTTNEIQSSIFTDDSESHDVGAFPHACELLHDCVCVGERKIVGSVSGPSTKLWRLYGKSSWAVSVQPVRTSSMTITVPDDYPTIQQALNNADEGDTVYVRAGTYYENVVVNKTVTLAGEDQRNTVIDGMRKGDVVRVSADNVVLSGFTIINSTNQAGYAGVKSFNVKNLSITANTLLGNWRGIWFYDTCNNVIYANRILNTTESLAIWLENTNSTLISSNIVTNNSAGVYLYYSHRNEVVKNEIACNNYYGLALTESSANVIIQNVIANSSRWHGIALWKCWNNTVAENNISNNPCGLRFGLSSYNTIYHNNFVSNVAQAYDANKEYGAEPWFNSWDAGYPSGGNYWSDYEERCPDAQELDDSGIWNTPYVIDESNQDNYPLMEPWALTQQAITATVEVDPDAMNLQSKGRWITAYIQLPEGYSSSNIDVTTILLNGTISPVLDPKYGFVTNSGECLMDHDGDGILERMVKFDRVAVQSWICQSAGTRSDVSLIITGRLLDGSSFRGTDTISAFWTSHGSPHGK